MPQVEATLAKLNRDRYLNTLDLQDKFWNVKLEESIPCTTFVVRGCGLYEFLVMLYRLHSAPATFQKLQETKIITPWKATFSYLDDRGGYWNLRRTSYNLKRIFDNLRKAGLQIKPDQCKFFRTQVKYLGIF